MADWSLPLLTSTYVNFRQNLLDRDVDAITLQKSAPSNLPDGAIKWDRVNSKFQEWSSGGASFADMIIALASGGTGSATAAGARTNLGLGTMAVQNANAVAITGGTIAGDGSGLTSLVATAIASGFVPTARLGSGAAGGTTFLRGDQTWATPAKVIPYGADQAANFVAAIETIYNVTAAGVTVTLPTVVGNGGGRVGIVNKNGNDIIFKGNGAETINGVNSFTFSSNQYDSAMLYADANGGKWDII
jgi:hypothetical protein